MNELTIVRFLAVWATQIFKNHLYSTVEPCTKTGNSFASKLLVSVHLFIIITEYHMCGTFSLLQSWAGPPMMGEAGAASKVVCLQSEDDAESWRISRPRQYSGLVADQRPMQ